MSTTGRPPGGSSGRTPGGSGGRPSGGARPGPARKPAAAPPAKSAVYRRRRALVGLVALLVLVGLGFGVAAIAGAFGDGDPAVEPTPTATAAPSPSPTISATAGYEPEACLPGVLQIRDGESTTAFAAGASVPFNITATNGGSVPCLIEGGSATLGVVIYSGSDRIWSSVDCPAEPTERELLLDVDVAADLVASWDQVRSAPGCPEGQAAAQPGTYKALVTLDGGGSAALGWERIFTIE